MKSIDIAIMLLLFCFAAILGASLYISYRGKQSSGIKETVAAAKKKNNKSPSAITGFPFDYNTYRMTAKERLLCILRAAAVIFTAGYIFYRSIALAMILLPLAFLYPRIRTKEIITKRREELNIQFREALYSISSSLSAGKAIETAFRDAQKELFIQYPDTETYILVELGHINKRIGMNETIEEALTDFAARSHLEDIRNFAEVFTICKRAGGNLVQVVKNTAEIISEKIDVKQEINVLLTEKRLEHRILNLMPILIVLMLSTSAEEFMSPVFTEILGRVAMTFSLMLFAAAYLISSKIMNIEV
jgi:tight adherence protein B